LIRFIRCVFTLMASLWSLACPTLHSGVKRIGGVQKYVSCLLRPIQRSDFLSYLVLEFGSYVTPTLAQFVCKQTTRKGFHLNSKKSSKFAYPFLENHNIMVHFQLFCFAIFRDYVAQNCHLWCLKIFTVYINNT
jgi:hypothetical protein